MKIIYTFCLLLCAQTLFGNGSEGIASERMNAVYMKAGLFEVSLGYQGTFGSKYSWAIEGDYRPRFKEKGLANDLWLSSNTAMYGSRVKLLFNNYIQPKSYWSFFISYRNLQADEFRYTDWMPYSTFDEDAIYEVYSQRNNEIGLGAIWNRSFKENSPFEFYIGGVVLGKIIDRQYLREGTWEDNYSSSRQTTEFFARVALTTGIKFKFIRF